MNRLPQAKVAAFLTMAKPFKGGILAEYQVLVEYDQPAEGKTSF